MRKSVFQGNQSVRSQDRSLSTDQMGAYLFETMLSFLICNNVTPIFDETGRSLQAASPDEISLVEFAEKMGFKLEERKLYSLRLSTPSGESLAFQIIRNFPFSSERKVKGKME